MAFEGCGFAFDGLPSSEFGLEIYEMSSNTQGDSPFTSTGEILTDTINGKSHSYLYGVSQTTPLEFKLTFGVNRSSVDAHRPLDRWDMQAISAWLTGHNDNEWKWLEIEQPDMETVRYRCLISELSPVSNGMETWAFSCRVRCDSAYGYTYPEKYMYRLTGEERDVFIFNKSSFGGYYYPKLEIFLTSGDSVSIVNEDDNGRAFVIDNLPPVMPATILVDNDHQVIKCDRTLDRAPYAYFNMNYFRLKRGDNHLKINGNGRVHIICEFPVNVGG